MKTTRFNLLKSTLLLAMTIFGFSSYALAHCQVPCGIYDDSARVDSMLEDAATVQKAIATLATLSGKTDLPSINQSVRWVQNKELHAQRIIETISDYFLTQRVKPGQDDYATRLARHHSVILAAMNAKQNTSFDAAQVLRVSIQNLRAYYPSTAHKH
ncbi:MAG: Uncharacterised protein [Opitutia bacterium UBA7350]|nr:MAG: Uncharacterised protein [Opitutae bacterium UBA7350]